MRFRMTTHLSMPSSQLWTWLTSPSVFRQVTSPMMVFRMQGNRSFPELWEKGETYNLVMYLGGILPLGGHRIHFVDIDPIRMRVRTEEAGTLIRSWKHTMRVDVDEQGRTRFEDELIIHNGILTLFTWLSAYVFFLYRHWKLGRLARRAASI